MIMRIIVAGSRDFGKKPNYFDDSPEAKLEQKKFTNAMNFMFKTIDFVCEGTVGDIQIVSGTADGADQLGEYYAHMRGLEIKRFPADWKKHGKSAGPIRNIEMGEYADMLVAFINNNSKGSTHMLKYMKSVHKPYIALHFKDMVFDKIEHSNDLNTLKIEQLNALFLNDSRTS